MIDELKGKKDFIYASVFIIFTWLVLGTFDSFEMIINYLETHEEYELDEILLLLIIIGFTSIFYSIRRINESNKINKQLENLNLYLQEEIKKEIKKNQQKESLLLEQSKMASMGEMIGNIAHQWRQPLNAISLVIQNIKFAFDMEELDNSFMDKSIKKVTLLTNEMSETIDNFRNFYKPNKEKEAFNLGDNILKSVLLVETAFNYHNINLNVKEFSKIEIFGYSNEFSQVIINILNNAKDAILDNNIINSKVLLEVTKDEYFAYVLVKDNAGGIPNSIIKKIFEPYFTTKYDTQGTGIGLYMSKIIIEENMNGKLSVENIDDGAEFTIQIPLWKGNL